MTKPKTKCQMSHHRLLCVRLTPEVLEFLSMPTKYGASRLSAYLYLLQNVAEATTPYKPMYGRTFNLEAGQLVISITDLANRWDWARETVRKFLDRLETLKILSKSPLDRCSILSMNIEWLDSGYESVISAPASYLGMSELQSDKMDKWLDGSVADSEMVEEIEDTIGSFKTSDETVFSHHLALLLFSHIRQLIAHRTDYQQEIPDIPDDYCHAAILSVFNHVLCGNWNMWLKLLGEYRPGMSKAANLSADDCKNQSIANGRAVLDNVFLHFNVNFFDR